MKENHQTKDTINIEFLNVWNDSKSGGFCKATMFDLDKYLTRSFAAANKHAKKSIPKHIYLLT